MGSRNCRLDTVETWSTSAKLAGLLFVVAQAGCVSQPVLMKQTSSGKAETTMTGATVDEVRNEIVLACTKSGKEVVTDSNSVTCSYREEGGRGFAAQVLMGNSLSSTPYTRVKFTFAQAPDGVFVVADPWLEMGMGFGEKKIVPLRSNALRNDLQAGLDAAAANARARRGSPANVTPQTSPAEPCVACARIGTEGH